MNTIILQDNYILIHCRFNRLDSSYAPVFRRTIEEEIKTAQMAVIIDLHDVEFIDSSGLGAIIGASKILHELLLCGIGENMKNFFRQTEADTILTYYKDVSSAVQAIRCRKGPHSCTCSTGGTESQIYSQCN